MKRIIRSFLLSIGASLLFGGCIPEPTVSTQTPSSPAPRMPVSASVIRPLSSDPQAMPTLRYGLKVLTFWAQAINDSGLVCGALTIAKRDPRSHQQYYEDGHLALWSHGKMTDLGHVPGTDVCSAGGINSHSEIVGGMSRKGLGHGDGPPDSDHIFFWSRGKLHDFGVDGEATAINDKGQIVGRKNWQDGQFSFLLTGGKMTEMKNPYGKQFSQINDVNNKGQMIGFAYAADRKTQGPSNSGAHLLLYENAAKVRDIPLPLHCNFDAQYSPKINNVGQIIVNAHTTSLINTHDHCYLYQNGKMTDLGILPGFTDMNGIAINKQGEVVGDAIVSGIGYKSHPFLWHHGSLYDLNDLVSHPGWTLTGATGLNTRGQIIGQGNGGGKEYNFLLTPVTR